MRLRTTIILAVIAALLGAFYSVSRVTLPTAQDLREAGRLVFGGDDFVYGRGRGQRRLRDLITRVEIEREGETVELERNARGREDWSIARPITAPAASGEIGMLCYELESLRRRSVIRPQEGRSINPADYGLDSPRARLSFTVEKPGEQARDWTLMFGDDDPSGELVYTMRSGDDAVIAVERNILRRLFRPVNQWRLNTVVRVEPDDALALEIMDNESGDLIICERDGRSWRITEPVKDYAEGGWMRTIFDTIDSLRIPPDGFVEDEASDLERYGLAQPRRAITVRQSDRTDTLLLGDAREDGETVYAMLYGRDSVFALSADQLEPLEIGLADLRRRSALRFSPDKAARVHLDLPIETIELVFEDDSWRLESPVSESAEDGLVRNLLNALARLEVKEWIDEPGDLGGYGLDPVLATVQITTAEGAKETLRIGRPDRSGDKLYAQRSADGPVLLIDRDIIRRLTPGHLGFLDRTVLNFSRNRATEISIDGPKGKFDFRRKDDAWLLESHHGKILDANMMSRLVWDISFMQATRYIERNPQNLARYGLDEPYIRLNVEWFDEVDGEREYRSREMLIGDREDEDARYAMMTDRDIVFALSEFKFEPLERDFIEDAE